MLNAAPLPEVPSSDGKVELLNVNFDLAKLEVVVGLFATQEDKKVVFEEVQGFRVLDESDLSAWWEKITLNDGWLFEVRGGGWFEHESQRSDFLSGAAQFYREFLVIGVDFCISVVAKGYPHVFTINRT